MMKPYGRDESGRKEMFDWKTRNGRVKTRTPKDHERKSKARQVAKQQIIEELLSA